MILILQIMYSRYEVAIGTYPGGANVHGFIAVPADKNKAVIENLSLIPDNEYFASVRATSRAGLRSSEFGITQGWVFHGKIYCIEVKFLKLLLPG